MTRTRSTSTTPLGAFLRELRERAGLTTAEVAQRSGRSVATCYRVEAGTSADPGLVIDFARACGAGRAARVRALVLLSYARGSIPLPRSYDRRAIDNAVESLWGDE